jgi:hypothetical protein
MRKYLLELSDPGDHARVDAVLVGIERDVNAILAPGDKGYEKLDEGASLLDKVKNRVVLVPTLELAKKTMAVTLFWRLHWKDKTTAVLECGLIPGIEDNPLARKIASMGAMVKAWARQERVGMRVYLLGDEGEKREV